MTHLLLGLLQGSVGDQGYPGIPGYQGVKVLLVPFVVSITKTGIYCLWSDSLIVSICPSLKGDEGPSGNDGPPGPQGLQVCNCDGGINVLCSIISHNDF